MTNIFHQEEVTVTLSAKDAAVKFAEAFTDVQVEFILAAINQTANWKKSNPHGQTPTLENQLAAIADEMVPGQRAIVVEFAKKVIEYFSEPYECVDLLIETQALHDTH